MQWAVVTGLHRGAVAAILQPADGQTRLGDDVEESMLLHGSGGDRERETDVGVRVGDGGTEMLVGGGRWPDRDMLL